MKYFVILLLLIGFVGTLFTIPQAFALCAVNEDWPEAPCLDTIGNGKFHQEEVDMWSDYYSYKGSIVMEQKYSELNDAIKEDRLQEWVDESTEHRNVYEYYFFSGRAPNTGEYYGQFDEIEINEEGAPEDHKLSYPNIVPIRDYDYGLIYLELMIAGIIGAGIAVSVFMIKRKRK